MNVGVARRRDRRGGARLGARRRAPRALGRATRRRAARSGAAVDAPERGVHRIGCGASFWAAAGGPIYLNAASTGPLPERTLRAQWSTRASAPRRTGCRTRSLRALDEARSRITALIGAERDSVALSVNTARESPRGVGATALGRGDVVVVPDLGSRRTVSMDGGVAREAAVHTVPARDGLLDEEGCWPRSGWRGWSRCRGSAVPGSSRIWIASARHAARGVWLVVDAMQGVGALLLDVHRTPIDLVACGGQKWLLSPWGSGFTYVRPDVLDLIVPQPVSWMGVRGSDDFSALVDYDLTWRDGARRFEQITLPF